MCRSKRKCFVTDGNGNITSITYDVLNRAVSTSITVSGIKETSTSTYDANGNKLTDTDWRGNTTNYKYDPINRLIEKDDAYNKAIEKLTYNDNSSQITSTDALGNVTKFEYDDNNRLTATIDPAGNKTSKYYDSVGNVSNKIDGNGIATTYVYDEFNRLISVKDPLGEVTSYTYDLNGNMLTKTDGNGNTTTFEYNVMNKNTRKIDQGGRAGTPGSYVYNPAKTESYTYFADGNMATMTDRNGNTTKYTLDIHGRLLSKAIGQNTITYTYDNNNNELTMTDSTGVTTRTYDELNRALTKAVPAIGKSVYVYDITDNQPSGYTAETTTDPKGHVTTKVYDKDGRLAAVTANGATTTYAYYDNGSRQSTIYQDGAREDYTYTPNGLNKTLVNKKADGTQIDSYSYAYDAANNQISKKDSKGTTTYTYDSLNRLSTVTEPDSTVTAFTYDRAGNRLTQTITTGSATTVTTGGATSVTVYDYNDQNRLQDTTNINNGTTEKTSYSYDNNGNVVSSSKAIVKPADSGVNVSVSIADEGKSKDNNVSLYKYDVWNELIGSSAGSNSAAYGYNGEGLRTSKTVNGKITNYLYEYDKVILEEDGQGNETARNVYGTNLLSRTADGQTADYMYNGHGDVTALMSTTGSATAVYYYDAFGNITESSGNADNPYGYAGYQYDKETSLYYLDARMYDPTIARFMQEDTYSGNPNDPLSLNLYTYCNNEPIMYTDPSGHRRDDETPQEYRDRMKSSSNTSSNSVHVGDWVQVKADGSIITDDRDSSKTIGVAGNGKWVQIYGKTSDGNYDIYYGDHGGTISAEALGLGGTNRSTNDTPSRPDMAVNVAKQDAIDAKQGTGNHDTTSANNSIINGLSDAAKTLVDSAKKANDIINKSNDILGLSAAIVFLDKSVEAKLSTFSKSGETDISEGGAEALRTVGEDGQSVVYRVIRADENPLEGLVAKNPERGMSVEGHVISGSRNNGSQFISTTTDINVVEKWAAKDGCRIVEIDLNELPSNAKVYDLSTDAGRSKYLKGATAKGLAKGSSEVLIEGNIPASAIKIMK